MRTLLVFLSLLIPIASVNDGGWITDKKDMVVEEGPCNIARHDGESLTQEEFLERYAFSQPVIIYNIKNEKFSELTERRALSRMLADWGDEKVVLNSANTYSYTRVPSTFGEYLRTQLKPQNLDTLGNETLYLFGDIDPTTWDPLLSSYAQPAWRLPGHDPALSFGIAGAGTGVPFHFHGPGFAEIIHGAKRWFLYPYEQQPKFDPDRTTLEWYLKDYQNLPEEKKPLECLMKKDEVIYFPDKWWHATLNTRTSVFISTFLSPLTFGKEEL